MNERKGSSRTQWMSYIPSDPAQVIYHLII